MSIEGVELSSLAVVLWQDTVNPLLQAEAVLGVKSAQIRPDNMSWGLPSRAVVSLAARGCVLGQGPAGLLPTCNGHRPMHLLPRQQCVAKIHTSLKKSRSCASREREELRVPEALQVRALPPRRSSKSAGFFP